MREVDVIRRIAKLAAAGSHNRAVLQGIGDDCAVVRPPAGCDLVFTTDFLIEGRHFTHPTHAAPVVGHKALARSLSDLAAMGAEPLFCLLSLALPPELTSRWITGFYKGFLHLAKQYRIALAGGDLSKSETVIADVMCCGSVPPGKALLRSGARPGDRIFVTGQLGRAIVSGWRAQPVPRIEAGLTLRGNATAAMDLSDGLSLDLARLCFESGVSADLHAASIPRAPGASLEDALHGGEDYELLFTMRPRTKLPALAAVEIGSIKEGSSGQVRVDGKRLRAAGFDHFN